MSGDVHVRMKTRKQHQPVFFESQLSIYIGPDLVISSRVVPLLTNLLRIWIKSLLDCEYFKMMLLYKCIYI